jgi:dTDP-4-amino-4,6-dideoxygalactose transaminase
MPLSHPLLHPGPPAPVPHNRPAYGHLVDGPATAALEQRWCAITGMADAAAIGSGTAALRLALLALGLGPGDEVIVPAYSCVALLNAPLSIGAVPVLADVLPDAWTLDPDDVRRRATRRTRAVIAVNLFGVPADVSYLGVPVIEDCAHGPILGRASESVSSFYATKLIGAGMGGIVAAHDASLISKVLRRRDYGDQEPDGRNLNDKITEDCAARALVELDCLSEALAERERLATAYTTALVDAVSAPPAIEGRAWYRYTPKLTGERTAADVVSRMKALGVHAEQPVWDLRGCRYWRDDLPVATEAFDRVISLPLYPWLTAAEQERVCDALAEVLR